MKTTTLVLLAFALCTARQANAQNNISQPVAVKYVYYMHVPHPISGNLQELETVAYILKNGETYYDMDGGVGSFEYQPKDKFSGFKKTKKVKYGYLGKDDYLQRVENNKQKYGFFSPVTRVSRSHMFNYARNEFVDMVDTLEPIQWTIADSFKVIGENNCQLATGIRDGETYEVWFTREIPYATGPIALYGLPGLIVEANNLSRNLRVYLKILDTSGSETLPDKMLATGPVVVQDAAYKQQQAEIKERFNKEVLGRK